MEELTKITDDFSAISTEQFIATGQRVHLKETIRKINAISRRGDLDRDAELFAKMVRGTASMLVDMVSLGYSIETCMEVLFSLPPEVIGVDLRSFLGTKPAKATPWEGFNLERVNARMKKEAKESGGWGKVSCEEERVEIEF